MGGRSFGYGGSRVFFQVPEIADSVTPHPPKPDTESGYGSAMVGRGLTTIAACKGGGCEYRTSFETTQL